MTSLLNTSARYDEFGNALDSKNPAFGYFIHPTFGIEMNKDHSFSGTPENIYIDNTEWTTSIISGLWDFESTTSPQGGTLCIDGTLTNSGNTFQLLRGSTIDLTSFTYLSGYIRITRPVNGECLNIYAWDTSGSQIIGNSVDILNYTGAVDVGNWVRFSIPLSDMDIDTETIQAIRVQVVDSSPLFDFYLDTFTFQMQGGSQYKAEALPGTWLEFQQVRVILQNNASQDYDINKLLGITITNPAVFSLQIAGTELPAGSFKSMHDILNISGQNYQNIPGDTTNSSAYFTQTYTTPIIIKYELGDFIAINLTDDFSGLDQLRISYYGNYYIR